MTVKHDIRNSVLGVSGKEFPVNVKYGRPLAQGLSWLADMP